MESLNVEASFLKNSKSEHCFTWVKTTTISRTSDYNKLLNWLSGEFTLYLQEEESESLKVYFPNGWFSIVSFMSENQQVNVEIIVKGKSRIACQNIISQLEFIYKYFVRFTDFKN